MIKADSIAKITTDVRKAFPEFEITGDMEGLPTVIFGFLTDHLIRSFKGGNTRIIKSFIDFVDDLSQSDDFIVRSCLEELIISLYSEAGDVYAEFRKQLPAKAADLFSGVVKMWTAGNDRNI